MSNKLTIQEETLLLKLGDIWNEFLKLEDYHPSDREEFNRGIHNLQRIVSSRVAVRENPDLFFRVKKP